MNRTIIINYYNNITQEQIDCITDDYIKLVGNKYYYEREGFKCTEIGSTIECDGGGRDPAIANGRCDKGEQDCIVINKDTAEIESKATELFDLGTKERWLSSKS